MTRRTNHVLREFLEVVLGQIARDDVSIERAAELMLEHGVPSHIATRIIARAQYQQAYPTLNV